MTTTAMDIGQKELPAGWKWVKLGDVCEIARGGSPRPISAYLTDSTNGVNWIKISDATASDKYIFETKEKIIPDGVSHSRLVYSGDFLLSNSMSFGRPYIMRTTGCIHDGWLVLRNYESSFDQEFLYYLLGSSSIYSQFEKMSAGSTVKNLNIQIVSGVHVAAPPLEEQKRIAAILNEQMAAVEKAKKAAQERLEAAKALPAAYLRDVFPSSEDELPEGWKRMKLGDLCDLQNGFAFKSNDYIESSNTLNIRLSNIRPEGNFDLEYAQKFLPDLYAEKYRPFSLKEGDLIIAMTDLAADPKILGIPTLVSNTDGHNLLLNQRVGRLHNFSEKIEVPFLRYALSTPMTKSFYKERGGGGLQINMSKNDVLSAAIPLPPLEEQKQIVSKLDDKTVGASLAEASIQQELDTIGAMPGSLLRKAFNGEL